MKPGNVIALPKQDRRYKLGNIARDKKGLYRAHPDTVGFKPLKAHFPANGLPLVSEVALNPPMIITSELAEHLKGQL